MKDPYTPTRFNAEYLDSLDLRTGQRVPPPRASRWERAKALLFAATLLALAATVAYKGYISFSKF